MCSIPAAVRVYVSVSLSICVRPSLSLLPSLPLSLSLLSKYTDGLPRKHRRVDSFRPKAGGYRCALKVHEESHLQAPDAVIMGATAASSIAGQIYVRLHLATQAAILVRFPTALQCRKVTEKSECFGKDPVISYSLEECLWHCRRLSGSQVGLVM